MFAMLLTMPSDVAVLSNKRVSTTTENAAQDYDYSPLEMSVNIPMKNA